MTIQPDPQWSWAVQRELDGLRGTPERLNDMATRINSSVTNVEYNADKRSFDLQVTNIKDKIDDVEHDSVTLKADIIRMIDEVKRENATEHAKLDKAIQDEVTARQNQQKEDTAARQQHFRWMISAVLIPIVLAVMDLMLNKK